MSSGVIADRLVMRGDWALLHWRVIVKRQEFRFPEKGAYTEAREDCPTSKEKCRVFFGEDLI